MVIRQMQVRYTPDWKPIDLIIDGTLGAKPLTDRTTMTGDTATSSFARAGLSGQKSDRLPTGTLLLPVAFWGPFEALAQRLKGAAAGSMLSTYNLDDVVPLAVGRTVDETIDVGGRAVRARRTAVNFDLPGPGSLDADIWADESGRLLRVSIPAQGLEVVREDLASVAARRVTVSRPGDEAVRIPADGFSLAGTLSKPAVASSTPLPAVILSGSANQSDRDETLYGVPIFGQIAGSLADAGFLVLRYDKRGTGQSGGRAEAARIADYADDLRAAAKFLGTRKDVDRKRIAVLGYSEGGLVAMLAAAKYDRIGAIVLVNTVGTTGADANLSQVQRGLNRSTRSEADKTATIELQKKIQAAVLSGTGWEGLSPALRRQADVPWFQSFLAFDPVKTLQGVEQPILVVHGLLDTQVLPDNADRLEALTRARKKGGAADVVKVPGVNHLLLQATTGEVDEYADLTGTPVSDAVTAGIVSWLQKTFAIRPAAPR